MCELPGLHYFYDMRSDIDCVDLQPVFGLYENGEMIGMGVSTLGMQTAGPDRTWLENTPKDILSVSTLLLSPDIHFSQPTRIERGDDKVREDRSEKTAMHASRKKGPN